MMNNRRRQRIAIFGALLALLVGLIGACSGGGDAKPAAQQQPAAPAQPAAAAAASDPAAPAAVTQPAASGTTAVTTAPAAPSPAAAAQFAEAPWEGMPQYGGQYRLVSTNPQTLNFLDNATSASVIATYPAFDRLLDFTWEGDKYTFNLFEPSLAESWESSADGMKWTFKLRQGVRFHDGDPLTSADVKATYDHLINPCCEAGPPGASYIKPFVASVDAPDPQTVVLTLIAPAPGDVLLYGLAVGWTQIVQKKQLDQGLDWFNTNVVGTGPFKWVDDKWHRNISFTVVRNDDYWVEDLPYLDSRIGFHIQERSAQIAAFETKRIDRLAGATPTQVQDLLNKYGDELKNAEYATGGISYLLLNARQPPFDDSLVRQAVYLFMDRQQFIDKVVGGRGYLTEYVGYEVFGGRFGTPREDLVKNHLAFNPDKTAARKKAMDLLKQAGYTPDVLAKTTVEVVPGGSSPATVTGNQVLVAQLREMGFDAELVPMERLAARVAYRNGDYGAALYGGAISFPMPDGFSNRYVHSTGQRNYSGLVDAELDGIIEKMNTTVDSEGRLKLIEELNQYLQTGKNATHLMYGGKTQQLIWNHLNGVRFLSPGATIHDNRDHRVWLGADAPGRQ